MVHSKRSRVPLQHTETIKSSSGTFVVTQMERKPMCSIENSPTNLGGREILDSGLSVVPEWDIPTWNNMEWGDPKVDFLDYGLPDWGIQEFDVPEHDPYDTDTIIDDSIMGVDVPVEEGYANHVLDHACSDCGDSFDRKADLIRHILKQHSVLPFCFKRICPECKKEFAHPPNTIRHMLRLHPDQRFNTAYIPSYTSGIVADVLKYRSGDIVLKAFYDGLLLQIDNTSFDYALLYPDSD